MRTSKPFSTITWNTADWLLLQLNQLVDEGKLRFWAAIHHKAEGADKKDHYHVYFEPDGQIDTHIINRVLTEYDPNNPSKPIRPGKIESSKFDHWFLYGCHDPDYLRANQQARKYHYSLDQFLSSDMYELERMSIEEINRAELCGYWKVIEGIFLLKKTYSQLFLEGYISKGQYPMYRHIIEGMIRDGITDKDIIRMFNLEEYKTKSNEKEHHKT